MQPVVTNVTVQPSRDRNQVTIRDPGSNIRAYPIFVLPFVLPTSDQSHQVVSWAGRVDFLLLQPCALQQPQCRTRKATRTARPPTPSKSTRSSRPARHSREAAFPAYPSTQQVGIPNMVEGSTPAARRQSSYCCCAVTPRCHRRVCVRTAPLRSTTSMAPSSCRTGGATAPRRTTTVGTTVTPRPPRVAVSCPGGRRCRPSRRVAARAAAATLAATRL